MFLLKKIFQLRDKAQNNEEEKPFLEHLEDLRLVITKIVITLLASTLLCFVFKNELMEIIRKPIADVWTNSQEAKMPKDATVEIDLDTWEMAKKAADVTEMYTDAQREYYFNHIDPSGERNLRFHTSCVRYYRAAIDIEKADQSGIKFIENIPGIGDDMRSQILALMDEENRPDAGLDARGKVVRMQSLTPTEGFMLSIKLAFFAGIVISFPLLMLFLLQFILPGLKPNEKRALGPALAVGFGLFLFGVCFSYFLVLPKVLDFFYNYSTEMGVSNEWRIGYYITFATQFTLIFGVSFELPVVVMTLVKLDILSYEMMRNTRRYAILAIVVIAAIITPTPDALTLGLLAGPMILLYEMCIWLAYFDNKKKAKIAAKEEAESRERRLQNLQTAPMTVSRDEDEEYNYDDDPYHAHDHDDCDYNHNNDPYHDQLDDDYHAAHPDECESGEFDDGHHDFDDCEQDNMKAKLENERIFMRDPFIDEFHDFHDGCYRHDPHMDGEYDPDDYIESIEQDDTSTDGHSKF